MNRGAWWATVYRVAKSRTRLKWLSMHALLLSLTAFTLSVWVSLSIPDTVKEAILCIADVCFSGSCLKKVFISLNAFNLDIHSLVCFIVLFYFILLSHIFRSLICLQKHEFVSPVLLFPEVFGVLPWIFLCVNYTIVCASCSDSEPRSHLSILVSYSTTIFISKPCLAHFTISTATVIL